jgi:hypothetical protein
MFKHRSEKATFVARLVPLWFARDGMLTNEGLKYRADLFRGARMFFWSAGIAAVLLCLMLILSNVFHYEIYV